MGHFTLLMVALYAISFFFPSVHAWTFVWRNASDRATVEHGESGHPCTPISHGKGKEFDWDPEGNVYCINLYRDAECNSRAGWSCPIWKKNASEALYAFIVSTGDFATSSPPVTSPSSTTNTTTASTTTTADPTRSADQQTSSTASSSGSSLSGGAIAGIVIGAVAGVALIGALAFFLGRRGKKGANNAANAAEAPDGGSTNAAASAPAFVASEKPPVSEVESPVDRPYRPPPGSRVVELAGDSGMAELSDSNKIQEMDGHDGFNRTMRSAI